MFNTKEFEAEIDANPNLDEEQRAKLLEDAKQTVDLLGSDLEGMVRLMALSGATKEFEAKHGGVADSSIAMHAAKIVDEMVEKAFANILLSKMKEMSRRDFVIDTDVVAGSVTYEVKVIDIKEK